jgi:hypothetical protein
MPLSLSLSLSRPLAQLWPGAGASRPSHCRSQRPQGNAVAQVASQQRAQGNVAAQVASAAIRDVLIAEAAVHYAQSVAQHWYLQYSLLVYSINSE